jgi:hypothetical protein
MTGMEIALAIGRMAILIQKVNTVVNQISDEVFTDEMHKHLKAQNMCKKDRAIHINGYLENPSINRDDVLDMEQYKAATYKKSPPMDSEHIAQCNVVHWFRKTWPDVKIHAIPNGADVSVGQRTKLIREGLLPGVSDLKVEAWSLHIEMKRDDGGSGQSPEQKEWEAYVTSIGHTYLLCDGEEDAKRKILSFVEQGNILNK